MPFYSQLMNQLIGPRFYEWGPKRHVNPLQEMMKNMFGPMPSNSNTSGKVTGSPMDTLD